MNDGKTLSRSAAPTGIGWRKSNPLGNYLERAEMTGIPQTCRRRSKLSQNASWKEPCRRCIQSTSGRLHKVPSLLLLSFFHSSSRRRFMHNPKSRHDVSLLSRCCRAETPPPRIESQRTRQNRKRKLTRTAELSTLGGEFPLFLMMILGSHMHDDIPSY